MNEEELFLRKNCIMGLDMERKKWELMGGWKVVCRWAASLPHAGDGSEEGSGPTGSTASGLLGHPGPGAPCREGNPTEGRHTPTKVKSRSHFLLGRSRAHWPVTTCRGNLLRDHSHMLSAKTIQTSLFYLNVVG